MNALTQQQAVQVMRRVGAKLRHAISAANASSPSLPVSSSPSLALLRASLVVTIAPVLDQLRALITTPTRDTALSILANLPDVESATVLNDAADGPFFEFLTAAFISGLAPQPSTKNNEPRTSAENSITLTSAQRVSDALIAAAQRGEMPTHLDTAGLRDLDSALRARSVFSARTTSAGYVQALKKLIDRHIHGEGTNNDLPQLRIEAREALRRFGYTPERGFPGDAALGVPSAEPGTLSDLASERRLNLIFDTQARLARGLGQKMRGLDRIDSHPCWELIRIADRIAPRDWLNRFKEGGASLVAGRMIAPKDAEIWSVLGDSAIYNDALDVDHPPFAFSSGMGWREVSWSEATALGMQLDPRAPADRVNTASKDAQPTPPPAANFIGGQATLDKLSALLRNLETTAPISRDSILQASRAANQ